VLEAAQLESESQHETESGAQVPTEASVNIVDQLLRASELPATTSLPARFDWRQEYDAPGAWDDLGEEINQGECGDCYSFAATLAFQMRVRIAVAKRLGQLKGQRV